MRKMTVCRAGGRDGLLGGRRSDSKRKNGSSCKAADPGLVQGAWGVPPACKAGSSGFARGPSRLSARRSGGTPFRDGSCKAAQGGLQGGRRRNLREKGRTARRSTWFRPGGGVKSCKAARSPLPRVCDFSFRGGEAIAYRNLPEQAWIGAWVGLQGGRPVRNPLEK